MSEPPVGRAASSETDEVLVAAYRVALALTVAVSAMRAVTEATAGRLEPLVHLPALVVLAGWIGLSHGASMRGGLAITAGYAAAMVWLTIVPAARQEAILVPAFMALVCIGAAGGLRWLWRWWTTDADPPEGSSNEPEAWIEEDGRRL